MAALYQISTNTVITDWANNVPKLINLPSGVSVHSPSIGQQWGDYKLIPTVIVGTPNTSYSTYVSTTKTLAANGTYVITKIYRDSTLSEVQAVLCAQVDNQAELTRLQYITPGAGQMGVYIMKFAEAQAIMVDPSPNPNNYPLNAASIGLPGVTDIKSAANSTITQYNRWVDAAATIENIRLIGKNNINAANDVNAAIAAYNAIAWSGV